MRDITPTHAALALIGAAFIVLGSCTPNAELRLRYTTEVTQCTQNERAIVDRQGTTAEQDRSDLAAERTRCDAALAAIEGAQ
jgi:Tfp pilus assembly protein PilV